MKSGVRAVVDRFELGAFRVLGRRKVQVWSFGPSHADSQILTASTATNPAVRFSLDASFVFMSRGVDRMIDYLVPFARIVVIAEPDSRLDFVGTWFVQRGAGTFDDEIPFSILWFDKDLGFGENI